MRRAGNERAAPAQPQASSLAARKKNSDHGTPGAPGGAQVGEHSIARNTGANTLTVPADSFSRRSNRAGRVACADVVVFACGRTVDQFARTSPAAFLANFFLGLVANFSTDFLPDADGRMRTSWPLREPTLLEPGFFVGLRR